MLFVPEHTLGSHSSALNSVSFPSLPGPHAMAAILSRVSANILVSGSGQICDNVDSF